MYQISLNSYAKKLDLKSGESFSPGPGLETAKGERALSGRYALPQESFSIPIYKDYAKLLDYDYELIALFNQIRFSNYRELSINKIREFSLSDRADQTLRNYLRKLCDKGLLKYRKNTIYQCGMWSVNQDIFPETRDAIGLCEGRDLKSESCYTAAALINKLRLDAAEGKKEISLSAAEAKQLLQTNKSVSSMRRILKHLAARKYITPKMRGRKYFYEINEDKLNKIRTPEVLNEQAGELSDILAGIRSAIHGETFRTKDINSLKKGFLKLLNNGYCCDSLKHILAYCGRYEIKVNPTDFKSIGDFKSNGELKNTSRYEQLYVEAYRNMSRRGASRFMYKLRNGMLQPAPVKERPPAAPVIPSSDLWSITYNWTEEHSGILHNYYKAQLKGLDYDFEMYGFNDYKQVLLIFTNINVFITKIAQQFFIQYVSVINN